MKIAVYCSAREEIAPEYREDAVKFLTHIAKAGHDVVYGGLNCGLMGVTGREVTAAGGHAIGVVPRARADFEHPDNMVNIYVNDLHERKAVMEQESDIFVALTGGVGTLDEVVSVLVSNIFNRTPVKIFVLNRDGIFDGFKQMVDTMEKHNLVSGEAVWSRLKLVPDVDALIAEIEKL